MTLAYGHTRMVERNNSFNALRLFFAVLVLIEHSALTSGHYFNFSIGEIRLGSLGVFGFFAASGFLITPGIRDGRFSNFILRRSARIFPAFWFVSVVTSLVFTRIWESQSKSKVHVSLLGHMNYFLHNIVFLPSSPESASAGWNLLASLPTDVPRNGVVNESIWTLPLEFMCYIVLGILITVLKRFFPSEIKNLLIAFLGIIWLGSIYSAFCLASFWEENPTIFATLVGKWPYILSFFFGSVLSFVPKIRFRVNLAFFIFPLTLICFFSSFGTVTWALFGAAAFALTTILIGESTLFRKFSSYTDVSYGIYLFHWPVQQTLVHFLDKREDVLSLILTSLAISALLAYLSAKAVELPAIKWARSRK